MNERGLIQIMYIWDASESGVRKKPNTNVNIISTPNHTVKNNTVK